MGPRPDPFAQRVTVSELNGGGRQEETMADKAGVDVLLLHADDNVCVAVRDLGGGERLDVAGREIRVGDDVPMGHKIAVKDIPRGERVEKYGQTIGFASSDIEVGAWVHTHNVEAGEFDRDYAFATEIPPDPAPIEGRTFMGYRRADGKVGTRNYLAVISSVNCSASAGKYIARRAEAELLKDYPNVDGVWGLTHEGGCGFAYGAAQHELLVRVLAGIARHPNVGGYLLVGLGCEVGEIPCLIERGGLGDSSGGPVVLTLQESGGTVKTVEEGVRRVARMLPRVNDVKREPIPASELLMATECGGSDGNSGITANPALGVASDMVVGAGGTAIVSELTEVYGAEHLLTRRAVDRPTGEKLVELIRWWERHTKTFGVVIDNNPTPGNKAGGITTIYEKSLGAVAKGGSSALRAVYRYAEPIAAKGLVVMDSPGYDPASVTGMVASGANVICFTTGRGSCFGCKPVPSIKIATNTPMYERMIDDMDVDAGVILTGRPVAEVGRQIFELVLEVAGGRKTKSELHGIGDEEFVPWHVGPYL